MNELPSNVEDELRSYLKNFPEITSVDYEISEDGNQIAIIVVMAQSIMENFEIAIPNVERILNAKFDKILMFKDKYHYLYDFNK